MCKQKNERFLYCSKQRVDLLARILFACSLLFTSVNGIAKGRLSAPVWQQEVGAELWSPATIFGDTLFFGADNGRFYAFSLKKRDFVWSYKTPGIIRSGAVVYKGYVLFASDDGYLYALHCETGKLKWRYKLGIHKRRLPALKSPFDYDYLHSTPTIASDTVYIGSGDGFIHSVDVKTGEPIWRFKTGGKVRSTPLVIGNKLYVGSWDGYFYALNRKTGQKVWAFDSGGIIQDSAASTNGKVFFGSRSTHFYALNAANGKEAWRFKYEDGSWAESSPTLYKHRVYVGSSDAFSLSAFDIEEGTRYWSFTTGGWSWSKPTIIDERIYIGAVSAYPYYFDGVTLQQGLFGVSLKTGVEQWRFVPPKIKNQYITGGVFVPPLGYKNTLIVLSLDGMISAFSL